MSEQAVEQIQQPLEANSQVGVAEKKLPKLTNIQLLNFCIGFLGLQFAWSMQIGLSGRVVEPLGATPIIFGLMWLAGPISGMLVQPIIGAVSDNIWTKFGRRRPFLLVGALLAAVALVAFPNSDLIGKALPYVSGLAAAAALLWIIDACVNISQGPYRALVPDIAPTEQHALANSFLSFAIGLGAVIAFGAAPVISSVFHYQMTIMQQFVMAAIAFVVGITWTCFTTKETQKPVDEEVSNKESAFEPVKNFLVSAGIALIPTVILYFMGFFDLASREGFEKLASFYALGLAIPLLAIAVKSFSNKEVYKLCAVQFFSWLGIMSMFIFFNNFVVHNLYGVPDLSAATDAVKHAFESQILAATNVSSTAFAVFNAVCLLVSFPISFLCSKLGKKKVHAISLTCMAVAFLGLALVAQNAVHAVAFLALAGIGWASVLALPFALLTEHIEKGTEGSAMGKFNLFIAGPQILSSVVIGNIITASPLKLAEGSTHHWEYAFLVGGISVLIAAIITLTVKEKCKAIDCSENA